LLTIFAFVEGSIGAGAPAGHRKVKCSCEGLVQQYQWHTFALRGFISSGERSPFGKVSDIKYLIVYAQFLSG
jgi:hypothetical protein